MLSQPLAFVDGLRDAALAPEKPDSLIWRLRCVCYCVSRRCNLTVTPSIATALPWSSLLAWPLRTPFKPSRAHPTHTDDDHTLPQATISPSPMASNMLRVQELWECRLFPAFEIV
jgi:hypothetical protein